MAYKPYRGSRKSKRNRLLLVLTLVLLVLIVGAAVFFTVQEYIVFTADGFRFNFPFSGAPTEPATQPPTSLPDTVVIEGTGPTEPPTTAPDPAPTQKREGLTRAALVPYSGYEAATLPQGADRRAVYILDRDGAARLPANAGAEPATDAQLALAGLMQGTGDVAVISAFRNHAGAAAARDNAVTVADGRTWLDRDSNRWLNPYANSNDPAAPDAATTVENLMVDASNVGLGEILLANFQFPTQGNLGLIDWGENDATDTGRMAAITAQASRIRNGFDQCNPTDRPMLLSCLLTETAAAMFVDEIAGQSVADLARYFDILYVPTADPDFDTGPLYEVVEGTGCRIGLWLDSATAPNREIDFILVR